MVKPMDTAAITPVSSWDLFKPNIDVENGKTSLTNVQR